MVCKQPRLVHLSHLLGHGRVRNFIEGSRDKSIQVCCRKLPGQVMVLSTGCPVESQSKYRDHKVHMIDLLWLDTQGSSTISRLVAHSPAFQQ